MEEITEKSPSIVIAGSRPFLNVSDVGHAFLAQKKRPSRAQIHIYRAKQTRKSRLRNGSLSFLYMLKPNSPEGPWREAMSQTHGLACCLFFFFSPSSRRSNSKHTFFFFFLIHTWEPSKAMWAVSYPHVHTCGQVYNRPKIQPGTEDKVLLYPSPGRGSMRSPLQTIYWELLQNSIPSKQAFSAF